MGLLKREDFYNTFFQKDRISPLFSKILYKHNNTVFYNSTHSSNTNNFSVNFISLFPQYLTPEISINKKQKAKRINQENLYGFAILLDDVEDVDSYLLKNLKSSTRSPIKKKIKRLESCFNIYSKMFYGEISEVDYNAIMLRMKNMLTHRFTQKNDSNEVFGKWNYYLNSTFALIKNKEASLFVMYSDEEIIGVSLNYHKNSVLIGHIIAYDIDYSKFGLGNTIVYKLIDWSIKNGYSILDMGNGALDYKRIWSSFSYNYEYYVVYSKSISSFVIGSLEIFKINIKNVLKKLKIVSSIRKIKKQLFSKKNANLTTITTFKFEDLNTDSFNEKALMKIETTNAMYKALKKTICDFVFKYQEHIDSLNVFSINDNTFVIKGEKITKKVTIN